jgi:hypothetical protein
MRGFGKLGLDWGKRDPKSQEWRITNLDKKEKARTLTARITAVQDAVRVRIGQTSDERSVYESVLPELQSVLDEAHSAPVLPDVAGNAQHWLETYKALAARGSSIH